MKKTKADVMEQLKAFEKKYESLVWYARKSPQQIATMEGVRIAAMEVESNYPEETAALRSHQTGDWTHGFNSGMLAATRYTQDCFVIGIEMADMAFPDLNS